VRVRKVACWGLSSLCRVLPRSWWDTMHRTSPGCWLSSPEPGRIQQLEEEMRTCSCINLGILGREEGKGQKQLGVCAVGSGSKACR